MVSIRLSATRVCRELSCIIGIFLTTRKSCVLTMDGIGEFLAQYSKPRCLIAAATCGYNREGSKTCRTLLNGSPEVIWGITFAKWLSSLVRNKVVGPSPFSKKNKKHHKPILNPRPPRSQPDSLATEMLEQTPKVEEPLQFVWILKCHRSQTIPISSVNSPWLQP